MTKRIFDILVAATCLVVVSPLLLAIAVVIAATLGRPVLFHQERPGIHGEPFVLVKFRTMKEGDDQTGQELPDALRLTAVGRLLRKTSLDELPELWNVLKGDMSLVGPRPLLMEYLPLYNPEQARRHEVRPGITGWAQVSGRNTVEWPEKFKLDVWYVDNQSLFLDLRILFMTVAKVLTREGISQDGHATMEPFRGNDA